MPQNGSPLPVIVAVDMGYGHLRAALPVAELLGAPMLELDRPPLADEEERRSWARVRWFHESTSRWSSLPIVGPSFRALMGAATRIDPLHPSRDLSAKTGGTRFLERRAKEGLGRGLVAHLRATGAPLFTTFYAPAVIADYLGYDRVFCLATDSDIHRVWGPIEPATSRANYFAPSPRARQRLMAYGVRPERVISAGFPLPTALLGGRDLSVLRSNFARRLARLDPSRTFIDRNRAALEAAVGAIPAAPDHPPEVVFAIGGAGAQAELAERFLPSLAPAISAERWRVTLVAGRRAEVRDRLEGIIERVGLGGRRGRGIEVLYGPDFHSYYAALNARLAEADLLWTKPSEMTFYAGLGLPLIFSDPVGAHEVKNRRWALESGAGLLPRKLEASFDWLEELLQDGTLAGAAYAGLSRFPADGVYRIADALAG